MSEKIYIYALCDPRTHEVRYVGQSKKPKERYYQHVNIKVANKERTHKCNWILELSNNNLKPTLSVIDTASKNDFKTKENYWISVFPNLTNGTNGGDTGNINNKQKGENHPCARLSEIQVNGIVDLYKYTNLSCKDIGELLNLNKAIIQGVVSGKNWKEITGGKVISLFDKQKYYYGEKSHLAKISYQKAEIIFNLYKYTNLPINKIAFINKVSAGCVESIIRGKSWISITGGKVTSLFDNYRDKNVRISNKTKQSILLEVKQNDYYLNEIADNYGVSVGTVARIKKDNNVNTTKFKKKHPNSILTSENVKKIIELYKYTNMSCNDLAKIFKINKSTIKNIVNGKQWQSINGGLSTNSLFKKRKHFSYNSKLKPDDVKQIKIMINDGFKLKFISDKYNVDQSVIGKIKNGKLWKYV